jgi:hypothetical protein
MRCVALRDSSMCDQWMAQRVELLGSVIILITGLVSVLGKHFGTAFLDDQPSLASLAVRVERHTGVTCSLSLPRRCGASL